MKLRRAKHVQLVDGTAINEELKNQIEFYKAQVPQKEVVEVEKIVERVVYRDDPALLQKYNAAMKELGAFKMQSMSIPQAETPAEVIRIQKVVEYRNSFKQAIIAAVISALISGGSVYLIKPSPKKVEVQNVLPSKKSK
jgi:hypothetical protein